MIYVDGSYNPYAKHGSWGFFVPSYQHEDASAESGTDSGHFELIAALRAVEWVLRKHRAPDPIEIRTDCQAVIYWMRELRQRETGYSRRSDYTFQYRDTLRRFAEIMRVRAIYTAKVNSHTDLSHARCHKIASEALTLAIQDDPKLREQVFAKDPEAELNRLIKTRKILTRRLDEVDDQIQEKYEKKRFRMSVKYLRWRHWRWVFAYSWRLRSKGMRNGRT